MHPNRRNPRTPDFKVGDFFRRRATPFCFFLSAACPYHPEDTLPTLKLGVRGSRPFDTILKRLQYSFRLQDVLHLTSNARTFFRGGIRPGLLHEFDEILNYAQDDYETESIQSGTVFLQCLHSSRSSRSSQGD